MWISGFSREQWVSLRERVDLVRKWGKEDLPQPCPKKEFSQTFKTIPVLDSYEGVLDDSYWSKWTKKTYESLCPVKSWICDKKLLETARALGYHGREARLARVV